MSHTSLLLEAERICDHDEVCEGLHTGASERLATICISSRYRCMIAWSITYRYPIPRGFYHTRLIRVTVLGFESTMNHPATACVFDMRYWMSMQMLCKG